MKKFAIMFFIVTLFITATVHFSSADPIIITTGMPQTTTWHYTSPTPCYGAYTYTRTYFTTITETYVYYPLIAAPPFTFTYVIFTPVTKTYTVQCNGYLTMTSTHSSFTPTPVISLPWIRML